MLGSGALERWENSPLPSTITGRQGQRDCFKSGQAGRRGASFPIGYIHQRDWDLASLYSRSPGRIPGKGTAVLSRLGEQPWLPGTQRDCSSVLLPAGPRGQPAGNWFLFLLTTVKHDRPISTRGGLERAPSHLSAVSPATISAGATPE